MQTMDIPRDAADCEAFFRNAVKLTLENKFPWAILTLIVDQMSPTVKEAKELVKVLLNELQILQKKHLEDKMYAFENLEEDSMLEELANTNDHGFGEDSQKDLGQITDHDLPILENDVKKSGIEKKPFVDAQNFDDYYDFIGSDNENETFEQTGDFKSNADSPRKSEFEESLEIKKDSNAEKVSIYSKLISTSERNYECKVCKKKFTKSHNMKIHERLHASKKPFECKHCKMNFSRNSSLKSHEIIHTGEKSFQCKFCKKKFSKSQNLTQHERTHTGEVPYECLECGKRFKNLSNLNTHKRTHTSEKPYACKYCKQFFAQHKSLKIHERLHTGEEPFECLQCGKRFKDPSNFRKHKKAHDK